MTEAALAAAIVAGERARRAGENARVAWAAAVSACARLAREPMVRLRCGRCGLHILGLARDESRIVARAAIHARVCPGGGRGDDVWAPLVHRVDVLPRPDRTPPLRLIRGGAVRL